MQDLLTRPFYAGRIVYQGETFDGAHEPLIAPEVFDRIQAARGDRDLGKGRHVVGRPAKRHALQRLATCGCCGRRMVSFTSAYTRKDGSKQRTYRCPSYNEANASCEGTAGLRSRCPPTLPRSIRRASVNPPRLNSG